MRGKKHKPSIMSRQAVQAAKLGGRTDRAIARIIGVGLKTLKRHYAEELANARAQLKTLAIECVANELATGGKHRMTAAKLVLGREPDWVQRKEVAIVPNREALPTIRITQSIAAQHGIVADVPGAVYDVEFEPLPAIVDDSGETGKTRRQADDENAPRALPAPAADVQEAENGR